MKLFEIFFSKSIFIAVLIVSGTVGRAQDSLYYISDIRVEGNVRTNEDAVIIVSGLKIGKWMPVPGVDTHLAIKKLWNENLFNSIQIEKLRTQKGIELIIRVSEKPLLGDILFTGMSASMEKEVRARLSIKYYDAQLLSDLKGIISEVLRNDGYCHSQISITSETGNDHKIKVSVRVEKNEKFRLTQVSTTEMNRNFRKWRRQEGLRSLRFLVRGKKCDCNSDLLAQSYQLFLIERGYLDSRVMSATDTNRRNRLVQKFNENQGEIYVFGTIKWEGVGDDWNDVLSKHFSNLETAIFSEEKVNTALYYNENFDDLTSIFMEKGFGNVSVTHNVTFDADNPIAHVNIFIDTGQVYLFGDVEIKGNIRTKEEVIRRELLVEPGKVFSRSAIRQSQLRLGQLGYINGLNSRINWTVDTLDKKIDVDFEIKEVLTDQFIVSGGFGSGKLIGTAGLDFNNFSGSDLFKKGVKWKPLPAGGGQSLSLKGQSDGQNYWGVMFRFFDPWAFHKRTGVGFSANYASYSETGNNLNISGTSLDVSYKPLKENPFLWFNHNCVYRQYRPNGIDIWGFEKGLFRSLSLENYLTFNTTNDIVFPSSGVSLKFGIISSLPPFLLHIMDQRELSAQEKFGWFEFYKTTFNLKLYQPIKSDKTVFHANFGFGYLGYFNKAIGYVPFGRYFLGGTGIDNFNVTANNYIGLRGYESAEISSASGDPVALKFGVELRQLILRTDKLALSSHLFFESGGSFASPYLFDLNTMNSSFGIGGQIFAPILGKIGLDIGWPINSPDFNWKAPKFQVTLGYNLGEF